MKPRCAGEFKLPERPLPQAAYVRIRARTCRPVGKRAYVSFVVFADLLRRTTTNDGFPATNIERRLSQTAMNRTYSPVEFGSEFGQRPARSGPSTATVNLHEIPVNLDISSHYCEHFSMAFSVDYFHARVLAEIESWPVDVLADYARIIDLLIEHGPNLKLPYSRAFGDGLFELRPRGRSGIGRTFYCFLVGKRVVILHAFIKKSQQTPDHEIKLARKRLKEVLKNG